jgi:hypothetical protein
MIFKIAGKYRGVMTHAKVNSINLKKKPNRSKAKNTPNPAKAQ